MRRRFATGKPGAAGVVPALVVTPDDPSIEARHVVAAVTFGAARADAGPVRAAVRVHVPLDEVGGDTVEVWTSDEPPRDVSRGRVVAARAGGATFGAIEVPEGPLADASRAAFADLLGCCERAGTPHPVRVWCFIPDIHRLERGLERYRAFCAGRARAFEDRFGPGYPERLCASTAVGCHEGRAVMYFLAGDVEGVHVENPRQVSAYRYPECHGPRSPSFARATVAGTRLLISGTASIVGHESLHDGDVRAQVDETLDNVDAVRREAGATDGRAQWKVYVRRREDVATVVERCRRRFGPDDTAVVLVADVCRRELLVEIEAIVG